ncbi:MAG TPA: hypothetical protein VF271_07290 [Rhodanobacteraceae bacterium]
MLKRTLLSMGLILGLSGLTVPCALAQSHGFTKTQASSFAQALQHATPYQQNNGKMPPPSEYSGPFFKLSHAWPTQPLPPLKDAPWQKAIGNGLITTQNAAAYAKALKEAVAKNARVLLMHYDHWNAAAAGWYNSPWLGSLREAIHGTYPAGTFGPAIFPGTGLRTKFNTHVLTYYDKRAAYSLYHFWGAASMHPTLETENAQFQEGSIIVKAAVFASTDPKQKLGWWDAMDGAQVWDLYVPVGKNQKTPQMWAGYVAQFDIIVKDSQSAPKTGWVFMTLVYDKNVPGDFWDKMVPLGVQWGNDPQATRAGMPLKENWINPRAPRYSTQTLGWGGRLSGPNDGARNNIVVNGKAVENAPDSSCMSCHSTAQWNVQQHRMVSFLLPSILTDNSPTCDVHGKPDTNGDYICSPVPGSTEWMKWFQNRLGTEPMDAGSFATDFDEVFSFKALNLWWQAVGPKGQPLPMLIRPSTNTSRFNQYTGAPLPESGSDTRSK